MINIPRGCALVFDSGAASDLDSYLYRIAETHTDDLVDCFADTGTEKTRPSLLGQMAEDPLKIILEAEI
jgi:hypothetical protein